MCSSDLELESYLDGYKIIARCDRPSDSAHNVGGGTLILQKNIPGEPLVNFKNPTTKSFGQCAQLCSIKCGLITLVSIYMTNPTADEEAQITNYLRDINGLVIMVGDLNLRDFNWQEF